MNRIVSEIVKDVVAGSYCSDTIIAGLQKGGIAAQAAETLIDMQKYERRELEKECANLSATLKRNVLEREIAVRHRRLMAHLDSISSFTDGIENAEWIINHHCK